LSLALADRPKLRFAGRSFLAFVLEPFPPVAEWFADLDEVARQSSGFFANRPVVLDLSGLSATKTETGAILNALAKRAIRVLGVEGVDPTWLGPTLAPLAGGMESAKIIDFPGAGDARRRTASPATASAPAASLVVERPVRSGQSIFHPDGDLTVLGAVSSGAEVIAGGSIHVHGALRGRAIAGATGNGDARIFCRKFEAELVAIDGCYLPAEKCAPKLIGKPVHVRLKDNTIAMSILD
jgi:septum site-determining protein MinC